MDNLSDAQALHQAPHDAIAFVGAFLRYHPEHRLGTASGLAADFFGALRAVLPVADGAAV